MGQSRRYRPNSERRGGTIASWISSTLPSISDLLYIFYLQFCRSRENSFSATAHRGRSNTVKRSMPRDLARQCDSSSWIHAAAINPNWIARAWHWPKHAVATSAERG